MCHFLKTVVAVVYLVLVVKLDNKKLEKKLGITGENKAFFSTGFCLELFQNVGIWHTLRSVLFSGDNNIFILLRHFILSVVGPISNLIQS